MYNCGHNNCVVRESLEKLEWMHGHLANPKTFHDIGSLAKLKSMMGATSLSGLSVTVEGSKYFAVDVKPLRDKCVLNQIAL